MSDTETQPDFELPESVALEFPGNFRPVPAFTIDIPPLWVVGEFPGALFMLGTQARDDGAYGNVIVQHTRVAQDVTIVELAQSSWIEMLENAPEALLVEEFFADFHVKHYVRKAIIANEDPQLIVNRSDSYVQAREAGGRTDDIFHFSWITPNWCAEEFEAEFAKILASFRFS